MGRTSCNSICNFIAISLQLDDLQYSNVHVGEMKLTLARPEHATLVSAFYQRTHDDTFAHTEMFNTSTVQQLIQDEELEVIVASEGKKVLGCGLGFPQSWNLSLEIGALSVDKIPERGKVGKALFESLRRVGLQKYGMAFFRAHTEASFRRGRKLNAVCWGYCPEAGAASLSNAELIMGMFNEDADTPRVTPPDNAITRLPFAGRIIRSYPRSEMGMTYPKNYPVGAPRGTGVPVISGRIWPTYHALGNYVTIESSAGPYPIEIIRAFIGKVRTKGVSDIRLTLPVSNEEAYQALCEMGFKPVSYLPGWFLRGPYRYDCVEMVAGLPSLRLAEDNFAVRVIHKINEDFGF